MIILLYNNINNDTNDINISKQLMTYVYFFTHQLYYNFSAIKSNTPNVIIYHTKLSTAILVINNNLLIINPDLFIGINTSVSIVNSKFGMNLQHTITNYNLNNSDKQFKLVKFLTYYSDNSKLYIKNLMN